MRRSSSARQSCSQQNQACTRHAATRVNKGYETEMPAATALTHCLINLDSLVCTAVQSLAHESFAAY